MTRQELEQIKALILQLSTKISSLPETTTLAGEDLFTIAKSEVGGIYTSKKMKMNVLAKTLKTRYPEINGSRFAGLASPRDEAFTPPTTTSLFWIAYTPGTYSAYGDIVVGDTPLAIVYDITTQQFSSLPLWEASSGTVKFSFAEDTIVDNQVISQKIAVSYGNEYDFELNIQPTDSYEKIIVRQYNFNDVMLDVQEYDTIRPKVTPVKNASYIVFAVTYRADNPVSAQNSYLLLTAPISVLANDVYSYVSVLADKVLPDVWPWEAISGLPTTLEGYGITDAVDTTTFTTVLQSYYTKTESDTRFQPAGYYIQRTDLRYLHFVAGAFEADEFIQGITEKTIKVPTATAHLTNNGANGVNPFVTQEDIDTSLVPINALIPNQASSENQLADKAFVNSSIATNTANFKGTYNSVEALANITGADANDYAFVSSVDAAGNTLYSRYKYSSGSWLFEYTLNNSSFTSDQWAAINSGITDSLVTKLSALPTNDALTTALAGKVDVVYGKGLSTNDFTDTYLDYMSGLTTSNVYLAVISFVGDVYQGVVLHNKVKNVLTNVWSSSEINLSDYYQDRESGKGLSTNDYTNEEKTKLGALPTKSQLDASLDEKVDKSGKETKDEIFTYQQTGGGLTKNVKNARVASYKGKTYVWNQLLPQNPQQATISESGITIVINTDGSTTISGTATANSGTQYASANGVFPRRGHKVYISFGINPYSIPNGVWFGVRGYNIDKNAPFIFYYNDATDWNNAIGVSVVSGTVISGSITIHPFVVDLTLLYGSEIDGLTDAQMIAKFEKDFPESYYPYNAGTLISNEAKEIESVEFNLWDEEWEVGAYNSSGVKITSNIQIRCKNPIPCFPSTTYKETVIGEKSNTTFAIIFLDAGGNVISESDVVNTTFTTPSNCHYFVFCTATAYYGTTYNNDICINLSDTNKNGTYEPYKKYSHKINLNSFKVTDGTNVYTINGLKSAGNVYDEIVGEKYIKRVGSVDLGSLDWEARDYYFRALLTGFESGNLQSGQGTPNAVTSKYVNSEVASIYTGQAVGFVLNGNYAVVDGIIICDPAFNQDEVAFKSAMNGVMLCAALATPIEYDLVEPISTDYPVDKLGTERVISDNICPIRVSTEYHEANISDIQVENITDYLKKAELKKELNTELTKLAGVETGAQVNDIEHIKIGSTEQTISEKTVSLPASYPKSDIADIAVNNKTELKSNQEFKFRKTNCDWDAKTEVVKKIYGKTLAWNQLTFSPNARTLENINGCTVTPNGHGFIINGTAIITNYYWLEQVTGKTGHKIFMWCDNSRAPLSYADGGNYIVVPTNGVIYTCINDTIALAITEYSGQVYSNYQTNCIAVDLTLMFGEGNEPSTVAEFESMFPGYHEAGNKLISNDAESIETVGFNLLDISEAKDGSINVNTGVPATASNAVYVLVPILSNTRYNLYWSSNDMQADSAPLFYYDASGNYIENDAIIAYSASGNHEFTTISGASYVRILFRGQNATINSETIGAYSICLNYYDPSKNGTYEPYRKSTLHLGLNNIRVKSHNIWDEEWELGAVDYRGVKVDSTTSIRSKNYFPLLPNTVYFINQSNYGRIACYDVNDNYIGDTSYQASGSGYLNTTPAGTVKGLLSMGNAYGTTYKNDICINVSSSFNGQYEPHGILTFNGVPSAGSVYDEIVGNKYVKRVGRVDLGTRTWSISSGSGYSNAARCTDISSLGIKQNASAVCSKYTNLGIGNGAWIDDSHPYTFSIGSTGIAVNDSALNGKTAAQVKSYLDGTNVDYELATPIEYELAEPMQSVVKVSQYGTESVVYEDNDVHAPFIADIQYGANSDDIIDNYDGVVKSLKNKLETLWNAVFNNS